ncbi:MAG: hypothetical protein QOI48_1092 [Solirubrobacteraceae bacterium]|jgi:hypothetical protein|nr:hypothetical protein [Solirubrobacteraceae bacterium]
MAYPLVATSIAQAHPRAATSTHRLRRDDQSRSGSERYLVMAIKIPPVTSSVNSAGYMKP